MRYPSTVFAVFLCSVIGACGDDATPTEPEPVFHLASDAQWAGGAVEISSDALDGTHDPVIVAAGVDTLVAIESAPGSVTALLPIHADGPVEITVSLGGTTHAAGTMDVYGSLGEVSYEPWLVSVPQEYPVSTGAAVIAYYEEPAESGFAVLDLTTGARSTYDALWTDPAGVCRTPALGPDPAEAYACTATAAQVDAWRLGQNPGIDRSLNLSHGSHFTARLSDSVWLAAANADIATWRADFDSGGEMELVVRVVGAGETQGFEMNRDLDLAIPALNESGGFGIPTFRMSTGELAYWAGEAGWWGVSSVTSSTVRNSFYVVGAPPGGETGLYAFSADDGSDAGVLPLGGHSLNHSALEYDSDRDLLYLFSSTLDAVLVIDPDTLEEVGRIGVEDTHQYAWVTMVLGMEEGVGYVVLTSADQGANGTPVLRFRLLQQ